MRSLRRHEPLARTLGATTAIGVALGLLIGGIGGRLAMRFLFLTSDESVRGVISDDGFEIGRVSEQTLSLFVSGTIAGVFGAFVYLALRPSLVGSTCVRSATCAAFAGVVFGGLLIAPEGTDFRVLEPLWLAAALFIVIPAAFAAIAPSIIEHALKPNGWARTASTPMVVGPLVLLAFPFLLIIVGVPIALVLGARAAIARSPRASAFTQRPAALWLMRGAWGVLALFGVFMLGEDIYLLARR